MTDGPQEESVNEVTRKWMLTVQSMLADLKIVVDALPIYDDRAKSVFTEKLRSLEALRTKIPFDPEAPTT